MKSKVLRVKLKCVIFRYVEFCITKLDFVGEHIWIKKKS